MDKNENTLESPGTSETVSEKQLDAIVDKASEIDLETSTEDRLEKVFSGKGLDEETETAVESEVLDDSTPKSEDKEPENKEPENKESEEESNKEENTTLESEKTAEEENTEIESKATDEDAGISKKDESAPQLSEAYYRAAIHRGMKPDEITDFYQVNPELCVKTLGNIYEAVKRSNEEFASQGRTAKQHRIQQREAAVTVETDTSVEVPEYKGIDFKALEKTDVEPDVLALIKTLDAQNEMLFKQGQKPKTTKVEDVQLTQQTDRARQAEVAAIQQQIDNFWTTEDVTGYEDFYGVLPKDIKIWDTLSPGQRANRWAVIEFMDDMLAGAELNNRDMKIDEAMKMAHLNISASEKEKVIRKNIKANATKRAGGFSLKPASSSKVESKAGPKSDEELLATTEERMAKIFNK